MSFPWVGGIPNGAEKKTPAAATDNKLGHAAQTEDGRVFRLMQNGPVALEPGVVVQARADNSSNDAALTPTATSSGAFQVTFGSSATLTKDEYASGFLVIDTAPGEAMHKIKTHPAASTGAVTVTLDDNDPIRVALSTVSKVGLRLNPYKNVIIAPTTITGSILGVTPTAIDSGAYFWAQVDGFGVLNTDGAPAVNTSIIMGASAGHGVAQTSAVNDVPDIIIAEGVDAGAGADKVNFVRIKIE